MGAYLSYIKLIFVMLFWSGAFISGRFLGSYYDALTISLIRFSLSSFFLICLFHKDLKKNKKAIQSNLIDIVFLSLSGVFLYNILFFKGLQTVHAAKAAVIIAFNPSITILISSFLFKEKMTLQRALGVILALAGAYVVISDGKNLSFKSIGEGEFYLLVAAFCWSFYTLFNKRTLRKLGASTLITCSCILGSFFLFLGYLFNQNSGFEVFEWIHLIHFFVISVLATVIGFFLYSSAIAEIGPAKTSIFINLVPVFSAVLGLVFLNESLTQELVLGGSFVIVGVFLVNWQRITEGEKKHLKI